MARKLMCLFEGVCPSGWHFTLTGDFDEAKSQFDHMVWPHGAVLRRISTKTVLGIIRRPEPPPKSNHPCKNCPRGRYCPGQQLAASELKPMIIC
jgi:hypothetical protein